MARKNIFQIVEENYDIESEIRKINNLFDEEDYFSAGMVSYNFEEFLNEYLFSGWKYRGTCISVEELGGLSGRFNYEFVCCLTKRIPRIYLSGGKPSEVLQYIV